MKYDTSEYMKHKRPGAWGSPCPDHIDNAGAQALLDTSSQVGGARFNVQDGCCYRAFSHGTDANGQELWHGPRFRGRDCLPPREGTSSTGGDSILLPSERRFARGGDRSSTHEARGRS